MTVATDVCEKIERKLLDKIDPLAAKADTKEPYNSGHSERVACYAVAIAKELGLPSEEIIEIEIAAKLHDIGKISIDQQILKKKALLTEAEWKVLKGHPLMSTKILKCSNFPEEIISLVLNHHERVDGKGYPNGKATNEIPIGAKIISLADAFDAMTTGDIYGEIKSAEEAKQELINNSGTQFDPKVVKAFLKTMQKKL